MGFDLGILRRFLRAMPGLAALSAAVALTACAPVETAAPQASAEMAAAKLGTKWGEGIDSSVSTVKLKRNSTAPLSVTGLRYGATPVQGTRLRDIKLAEGRVAMRVLRENGTVWPMAQVGTGLRLQGQDGARYTLEYRNLSKTQTYEIVATVDGLDVLNGEPGTYSNRGYILRPGETVGISGFRKSRAEVAAFRFSNVADSYAANSRNGSPQNVGVIGTAVFAVETPPPFRGNPPPASCGAEPDPFPGSAGQQRYAPPPCRKDF